MARSLVLDQQPEVVEKKKSRKGLLIGIGLIAIVPVLGSTLAASITIGSGAIEFGQGAQVTTACDTSITTGITAAHVDGSGSAVGTFKVGTVTLSNVDAGSSAACDGKTFTVKLLDTSGAALTDGTVTFKLSNAGTNGIAASPAVTTGWTASVTGTTVTLTPSNTVTSTSVNEITVESS